MAEDEDSFN